MTAPLVFGAFPLGFAGAPAGVAAGPPDDFQAIVAALTDLRGDGPPLLPRMYLNWTGPASTATSLAQAAEIAGTAAGWDLVLCFRDRSGDIPAWTGFVEQVVAAHGRELAAIQVTAEANLRSVPDGADGAFPGATTALVAGVLAAARVGHAVGATAAVGFAVVPEVDPAHGDFWPEVARLGGEEFAAAVDYAGIDMYPDVFGAPINGDRLPGAVDWILRSFRREALPLVGIGATVPIRICENGWPTGPGRDEHRQAAVLDTIVRTVAGLRAELHVTHWELFALRDADSSNDDLFHRFGILHDDYTPKVAYATVRRLIAEFG